MSFDEDPKDVENYPCPSGCGGVVMLTVTFGDYEFWECDKCA